MPAVSNGVRSDVTWSALTNVLQLLSRTATFLMLSRQLGPSGYGAFLGLYGILNPVGGLTYGGLRLSILQRVLSHKTSVNRIARTYFALTLVQGIIGILLSVALASYVLHAVSLVVILSYATIELMLGAVIDMSSGLLHAVRNFAFGAKLRVFAEILRAVTAGALYLTGRLTLGTFSVALLIGNLLLVLTILLYLLPAVGVSVGISRPSTLDATVSAHLALTLFAAALKADGDKTVLSAQGLNHDAGVYGAGYRVMQMIMLPALSVQAAVFDRFLHRGARDPQGQLRESLRFTVPLLVISAILAGALLVASPWLHLLLGNDFRESQAVVQWLAAVPVIMSLSQGPANALAGLNRLGLRSLVIGGSSALSLMLYIVLIPQHGWRGAAVGTLISETVYAVGLWCALIMVQRRLWQSAAP
jgi:O-antigen/teichoic acid export membrane protein